MVGGLGLNGDGCRVSGDGCDGDGDDSCDGIGQKCYC